MKIFINASSMGPARRWKKKILAEFGPQHSQFLRFNTWFSDSTLSPLQLIRKDYSDLPDSDVFIHVNRDQSSPFSVTSMMLGQAILLGIPILLSQKFSFNTLYDIYELDPAVERIKAFKYDSEVVARVLEIYHERHEIRGN